jgi:PAS domain S-box-containing protein
MDDKPIKVLLIEDNPGDARLVQEMLVEARGAAFDLECADRLSAGLEYIADDGADVVLLDLGLPDSQGLETFDRTYAQAPEVPILVLLAVRAVQKGAQDYLVKGQVDSNLLARAVSYAIERKRAQEALRDSEERYRDIIESAHDMIQNVKPDGHFEFVNRAWLETLGYTGTELSALNISDIIHPDSLPHCREIFSKIMAGKAVTGIQATFVTKDGRQVFVEGNATPRYLEGKVVGTHAFFRDITKRKQAEKELKKYASELEDSNRLKDLFTDIMTHDLLGPAGAIKNATELMLEEAGDTERKTLEVIEWGAKKQIEIIELTRKISKLESKEELEKKSLDLKEVIANVIEDTRPLFEAAGMRVENRATKPMPLRANSVIEDVFLNLLSNAVKYAADGEKVVIEALDEDGGYTVRVEDHGPGIPEKDRDGIFKRFMRRGKASVKGTGLGLAIAKCIVDLHKGKIWVEANPEGGAVFKVSLPRS